MKFQFRLSEQRDGDIIYWLNHTEDKSEAIRRAIRAAIAKEEAVSEMLAAMTKIPDDDAELAQAIKDVEWTCEHYKDCDTLDYVKQLIGWMYPGDKSQLLDMAWKMMQDRLYGSEVYADECNAKNDSNTLDALDPCKEMNNNAETI